MIWDRGIEAFLSPNQQLWLTMSVSMFEEQCAQKVLVYSHFEAMNTCNIKMNVLGCHIYLYFLFNSIIRSKSLWKIWLLWLGSSLILWPFFKGQDMDRLWFRPLAITLDPCILPNLGEYNKIIQSRVCCSCTCHCWCIFLRFYCKMKMCHVTNLIFPVCPKALW